MKKALCFLLAIAVAMPLLFGCSGQEATPTVSEQQILSQRRQAVLEHMRGQLDVLWTCQVVSVTGKTLDFETKLPMK